MQSKGTGSQVRDHRECPSPGTGETFACCVTLGQLLTLLCNPTAGPQISCPPACLSMPHLDTGTETVESFGLCNRWIFNHMRDSQLLEFNVLQSLYQRCQICCDRVEELTFSKKGICMPHVQFTVHFKAINCPRSVGSLVCKAFAGDWAGGGSHTCEQLLFLKTERRFFFLPWQHRLTLLWSSTALGHLTSKNNRLLLRGLCFQPGEGLASTEQKRFLAVT